MGKTTLSEFFSVHTHTRINVVKHDLHVKFLSLEKSNHTQFTPKWLQLMKQM